MMAEASPAAAGNGWWLIVTALVSAFGLIFGGSGLWAWLATRRDRAEARAARSGTVGTSQADVLWATMQQMLTLSQAREDKAVAQVDKLIDSYGQIRTVLEAINQGLAELAEHFVRNNAGLPPQSPPAVRHRGPRP